MRDGYLVRLGENGHYLQWHGAPQTFEFTAAETRFATVFSRAAADRVLRCIDKDYASRARIVEDDYWHREPTVIADDLILEVTVEPR